MKALYKYLGKVIYILTYFLLPIAQSNTIPKPFLLTWNAAQLTRIANTELLDCSQCPDKKMLGNLGNGNGLSWQFTLPHSGRYELRLLTQSRRGEAEVPVVLAQDGFARSVFTLPQTSTWQITRLQLFMTAGQHTLSLNNLTQMYNDIAQISLSNQLTPQWQFKGYWSPDKTWFAPAQLDVATTWYCLALNAMALLSLLLGLGVLYRTLTTPRRAALGHQPLVLAGILGMVALALGSYAWEELDASWWGSQTGYFLKLLGLHGFGLLNVAFSFLYIGRWNTTIKRIFYSLTAGIITIAVLEFIDPWTQLIYERAIFYTEQSFLPLNHPKGKWLWLPYFFTLFSTVSLMITAGLMLAYRQQVDIIYRKQMIFVALGMLCPVLGAYILSEAANMWGFYHHDQSISGLLFYPLIMGYTLWKVRLLQASPALWLMVQHNRTEPEWVISKEGELVQANKAAQILLNTPSVGKPLYIATELWEKDIWETDSIYQVNRLSLPGQQGTRFLLVDITELQNTQRQLQMVNAQLEILQSQLTVQAQHDSLTGLYNRHALHQFLTQSVGELSVILIDVDNFREFNTRYGYSGGDTVLCHLAELLRAVPGRAHRYGGEEFLLVLPNMTLEPALLLAQELCHAVAALSIYYAGHTLNVAISVGVASNHTYTMDQLLSAADRALQVAKRRGKNRVEIAQEQPELWERGWG